MNENATKNYVTGSLFCFGLILSLIAFSPSTAGAQDLTGVWKGDDGATYHIRHIPRKPSIFAVFIGAKGEVKDDVYWFGQGTGFGNVFHGMISKGQVDQITGEWADVPVGGARNSGFLRLAIASPDRLVMMGEPGNFAAREWKRVKVPGAKPLPLTKIKLP